MAEQYDALAEFFDISLDYPWDEKFSGTALSLPSEYEQIALKGDLYVEYLRLKPTETKEDVMPNKNHVVFRVPFAERFDIKDNGKVVTIHGARIEMNPTDDNEMLSDVDVDHLKEPYTSMTIGIDYLPGTLWIKLLKYDEKSIAAKKISKFTELKFTTLGEFIGFLFERNLHQMSFLGYSGAWKGCRDFVTQTFLQMRQENKIAALDEDGQTLEENIMMVYHDDGTGHPKRIDRGLFLGYNHIFPGNVEDAYETESFGA